MAAILVIEDDHNLQGLIEKILPQNKFRFLGRGPDDSAPLPASSADLLKGDPGLALEEIVREVLKVEVDTGNADHIHESIIGKVEKALIGIVLEQENGNQVRASKKLGINRNTLRKKMKDLQISTRVVTH
jgi:two-component system, NtrC family, nitrogen regulation response regulator GlnG